MNLFSKVSCSTGLVAKADDGGRVEGEAGVIIYFVLSGRNK